MVKKQEDKTQEHIKHFLVPKHRLLSEEEKKSVLEKYNITAIELPQIMSNDVIVKEIGAKVGDIIEIKRNSSTSGEALYYRYVVS